MYEKLLDLAQILAEYHGYWPKAGMAGNPKVWADLQRNYTQEELQEATKIMLKQVSWSQIE